MAPGGTSGSLVTGRTLVASPARGANFADVKWATDYPASEASARSAAARDSARIQPEEPVFFGSRPVPGVETFPLGSTGDAQDHPDDRAPEKEGIA